MAGRRAAETLNDHVVICNVNEKVPAIVDELWNDPAGASMPVVLIVQDESLWLDHPDWHPRHDGPGGLFEIHGCPAEPHVLRQAGITRARAAIILADPVQGRLADARSALIGIAVEKVSPTVHTVIELLLSVNRSHLRTTAVDEVICLGELSGKLLSVSSVTPGVSRLFAHLLTTRRGTAQIFVRELPEGLSGTPYREIARRAIRRGAPYVVCGFIRTRPRVKPDMPEPKMVVFNPRADTDPGKNSTLGQHDSLIVLSAGAPDLRLLAD